MNLLPKNEWLDGEDLVGKLMNTFWDDRKMSVDIRDLDDYYEVKADLPGFEKEEISVASRIMCKWKKSFCRLS